MCIGIYTLEHPEYALILCTNRDEFLHRPTENAHFHSFGNGPSHADSNASILSGRDLQAGGSWFGVNRAGRLALLTNITEPLRKYNTSRGALVSSFLLSDSSHPLEDEIGKIVPKDAVFAGFNLLLLAPAADGAGALHYNSLFVTNHGGGGTLTARPLSPAERACGGISNGVDGAGADAWGKVQRATHDFGAALKDLPADVPEAALLEHLFGILDWHPAPTHIVHRRELRDTVNVLPVRIVVDRAAPPSNNDNTPSVESTPAPPPPPPEPPAYYGTRLSTVVLVKRVGGAVLFVERDVWVLDEQGEAVRADAGSERRFRFNVDLRQGKEEEE